jgi:hypothetical protein
MTNDRTTIRLETARDIVKSETARPASVRHAAWDLFEAGRFDLARQGFERLIAAGQYDADVVTALQQVYLDRREYGNASLLIERYLQEAGPDLTPEERLSWSAARLDALTAGGPSQDVADAALQLLEAAAAGGPADWETVLVPERRAAIEAILDDPSRALTVLEQFMYAPEATGLPAQALALIEEFGYRHASDRDLARAAERLLHASGAAAAAYRVEFQRRSASHVAAPGQATASDSAPAIPPRIVTVAGGHAALRAMAERDLATIGVAEVRQIPPAWEATRPGKAIRATLGGSDLAVVIGPQIAHSTSDQIRAAAAHLGIPVVTIRSAGIAAIRQAVEHFATATGGG